MLWIKVLKYVRLVILWVCLWVNWVIIDCVLLLEIC